eukprot:Blabericola_migrator_1__11855@NODE_721_length_6735_cov_131_696611_g519_i0_p5_GENE_NODE_721_length_6735_cov_131_696611_g519_i0NODE_721_length_6735_cov_131_696611_g519_i0_p5_ORF_typecomplete_len181_score33_74Nup35_RRM/PF05172_13/7_4e08Nup35_RRM_2/PF14605_6/0_0001_NODE_721_length_6735_cov_131_696611_g519_i029653507
MVDAMSSVHRRGLKPSPPIIVPPQVSSWIQILGFPPELWPEVRALIEQKCGHIEEEVRHPSCNWSLVRFGNPGDAEEALKWNDQAVLEGVWVYVTRLTQAQAHYLSFPITAPAILTPETPDYRSPAPPLSPRPMPLPLLEDAPPTAATGVTALYSIADELNRLLQASLTRLYVLPIVSSW